MDVSNAALGYFNTTVSPTVPAFNPEQLSYFLAMPNYLVSFVISCAPAVSEAKLSVTINGMPVLPTGDQYNISMNTGKNDIKLVVTSADGSQTRTYSIVATRKLTANMSHGDKFAVRVNGLPTASEITYGQQLSASILTGGTACASDGKNISGHFAWMDESMTPIASEEAQTFSAMFIPDDQVNYATTKVGVKPVSYTHLLFMYL